MKLIWIISILCLIFSHNFQYGFGVAKRMDYNSSAKLHFDFINGDSVEPYATVRISISPHLIELKHPLSQVKMTGYSAEIDGIKYFLASSQAGSYDFQGILPVYVYQFSDGAEDRRIIKPNMFGKAVLEAFDR